MKMNRRDFLIRGGVAAATSPLWLGAYACKKKDKSTLVQKSVQEVEVDPSLVSKLEIILNNVKTGLSAKELTVDEYRKFIFEQLKIQEFLSGSYIKNISDLEFMKEMFDEKLSTQYLTGLENDYVILESTPISQKTEDDTSRYRYFKGGVLTHLKDAIGEEEVPYFKYISEIERYVSTSLPSSINPVRKVGVVVHLVQELESEFNIRESQLKVETIRKALEKIVVK